MTTAYHQISKCKLANRGAQSEVSAFTSHSKKRPKWAAMRQNALIRSSKHHSPPRWSWQMNLNIWLAIGHAEKYKYRPTGLEAHPLAAYQPLVIPSAAAVAELEAGISVLLTASPSDRSSAVEMIMYRKPCPAS